MNYEATLKYLDVIQAKGIKLGLENMTSLLAGMGAPQQAFPAVVVGGTNGKGSVCAMLASILKEAGLKAGLYTSPHLIRYEERIAVNGAPVTPAEFARAVTVVRTHVDALLGQGDLASHPTHFEILTAAAFHHFREAKVDVGILEVGMGGRLDAVAMARTAVAVVTNVGLEHTRFLGDTLEAIAREKTGIFTRDCRAVTGENHPGPLTIIRNEASRKGVALLEAHRDAEVTHLEGGTTNRFGLITPENRYEDLRMAMAGRHQVENATVAVLAAEALAQTGSEEGAAGRGLEIPYRSIAAGLARAHWPGRLQVVGRAPLVLLDGAHNPPSSRALARSLDELVRAGGHKRVCLIVGLLRDKNLTLVLEPLLPLAEKVVVTRGRSDRFCDPRDVAAAARDLGCEPVLACDVAQALRMAREWASVEDAICLCGSLYLVGDAMKELGVEPFSQSK